jgi:uroporphyrinogen-III synthase
VAEAIASPLAGKTIVVTRAAAQSGKLCEELRARGAEVRLLPLISFEPPENYGDVDGALRRLAQFDWILFTSANAVHAVEQRRQVLTASSNGDGKLPRVAAVGPATAEAAEAAGFSVEFVASHHSGAGLAEELGDQLRNRRVFLPRSDRANPDLPAALLRLGAAVTEVVAYRTVAPSKSERERVLDTLKGGVDGILFYSPSAVQNLLELLGRDREKLQGRVLMVAIGPTTAGALSAAGVQRIAWAADATTTAVIGALEGHLSRTRKRVTTGAKEG